MKALTFSVPTLLLSAALVAGPGALAAAQAAEQPPRLTYVGCDTFFGSAQAPATRLNIGPGEAPLGRRSLGLVPTGPGGASGPVASFQSLGAVDLQFSALSTEGTTGVSYVWAITPDLEPGTAWLGTARLTLASPGWQSIAVSEVVHDWSVIDLVTTRVVGEGVAATPAQHAASHGDGPGYSVSGFGCDGGAFNIDAVRAGGQVLDFEAITLLTQISVDTAVAAPGQAVVVRGEVRDSTGRITGDPLQLQRRLPDGSWEAVGPLARAGEDGASRAEVVVDETTHLRWFRPEGQYADEGWSEPVVVEVATQ